MKKKVIVSVSGASGSIYGQVLFRKLVGLKDQIHTVGVTISDTAREIWAHEIGDNSYKDFPFTYYEKDDFHAPFASGSAAYDVMIVCPCSMGLLGRIAAGISDDLATRAADV